MFKIKKDSKNYLQCNELIIKAMIKRRRLAMRAISNICDIDRIVHIIK